VTLVSAPSETVSERQARSRSPCRAILHADLALHGQTVAAAQVGSAIGYLIHIDRHAGS
jgi:hypothetical protein